MQLRTMRDVAALARSARLARGLTQADLAAQLRVSRDWVVRLEKGHLRLEVQLVLDALHVLGVELRAAGPPKTESAGSEHPPDERARDTGAADPFDDLFGIGGRRR